MPSSVPLGALLAGKYRVDGVLGAGGMGVVLLATHVHLRQKVAVKLLHPETALRRGAVERFLREARVAMSLRGEHVVRIFDVGTLDDGSPFIAMERLEGRDFGALVEGGAPIAPSVAVDHVLQAIEAVAEAHALGVVHRDLKPANLFLTKRVDGTPCVKVLDFGVSKIDEAAAAAALEDTAGTTRDDDAGSPDDGPPAPDRITRASAVVGSPRYMAPEQIVSPADVDARADVWALGVILHELMTGAPPFEGRTLDELRANVTKAPAPPMRGVPAGLQAVVRRCLAKAPGERHPSVHALAQALAPFSATDGAEAAARIGRIVSGGTTASDTPLVRDLARGPRAGARRVAVGAAAVAAASVLALSMTLGSRAPHASPVAASGAVGASGAPVPTVSASSPSQGTTVPAPDPVHAPSAESAPSATPIASSARAALATAPTKGPSATRGAPAVSTDAGAPPAAGPPVDPLHLDSHSDAGALFERRK